MATSRQVQTALELAGKRAPGDKIAPQVLVAAWARPPIIEVNDQWLRWTDPADAPIDDSGCVDADPGMLKAMLDLRNAADIERFAKAYGTLYGYSGLDLFPDGDPESLNLCAAEPLAHWYAWRDVLLAATDLIVRSTGREARRLADTESLIAGWYHTVGAQRLDRSLDTGVIPDRRTAAIALRNLLNDVARTTRTGVSLITEEGERAEQSSDEPPLHVVMVRWAEDVRAALTLQVMALAGPGAGAVAFCDECGAVVISTGRAFRTDRRNYCEPCKNGNAISRNSKKRSR